MKPLATLDKDQAQYRAYEDIDYQITIDMFDEAYREELIKAIEIGEYGIYEVRKFEICGCNCPNCNGWKEVDSCGGYIAKIPKQAIEQFIEGE